MGEAVFVTDEKLKEGVSKISSGDYTWFSGLEEEKRRKALLKLSKDAGDAAEEVKAEAAVEDIKFEKAKIEAGASQAEPEVIKFERTKIEEKYKKIKPWAEAQGVELEETMAKPSSVEKFAAIDAELKKRSFVGRMKTSLGKVTTKAVSAVKKITGRGRSGGIGG